jgi:uncharacterized repeat protein (TIGR03803 family)
MLCKVRDLSRLVPVLLLFLALSACGGGGGGGGGSSCFNAAGSAFCGTVSGLPANHAVTLDLETSDLGGATITLSANGPFTYDFQYQLHTLTHWTIAVPTQSSDTTCTVDSIGTNIGSVGITTSVTGIVITCSPAVYYTVGGTLTGLSSGGRLTLEDSIGTGLDTLTVTANGPFTFATPIRGLIDSYSVGVDTQPTGQLCAVTNNEALHTQITGNVTNVQVTCGDTVGGSLTGLRSGGRITLLDNGGDSLVVTANGAFTFPSGVAAGQPYAVTVGTQPTGEYCSVTSGNGSVSGPINSVQVACTSAEQVLYSFSLGDESQPSAALIMDSSGNLYGTTYGLLEGAYGTVFKLAPIGSGGYIETTLHHFTGGSDGGGPLGSLIMDSAGNLYGTTTGGGGSNGGTVFKLAPDGSGGYTESILYSFLKGNDGAEPYAGLIMDSAGNFYGTTLLGGSGGVGTAFKLAPNGSGGYTESVLYSFTGSNDGAGPRAGLTLDAAGNLYGTTHDGGGASNLGVVFKLAPNGSGYTESILHSFAGVHDGNHPTASLIIDSSGNLYGTTGEVVESDVNMGTVFKLAPNGSGGYTESVLHDFTAIFPQSDGINPAGGLIMDSAGNLYGTTSYGTNNPEQTDLTYGTVFKLTPDGTGGYTESLLYNFLSGSDGAAPTAGLIMDTAGNLYGTTAGGGASNEGTVFKISTSLH